MNEKKHKHGQFESVKFEHRRQDFQKYLDYLENNKIQNKDILEHYTSYAGHMALHRIFTLYEFYKMVSDVAGHIAEVGVYKGAGTMLFAKLVHIHESESLTQVHGFDWFRGTEKKSLKDSKLLSEGGYKSNYNDLIDLIAFQKLEHIVRIHNINLASKKIKHFFDASPHLQFKLIFMDIGIYSVMSNALPIFFERLTPGGVMVFDQYNHELGPGETLAIRENMPNLKIRTLPNSWMPNAYIIK